ncbi:alcohol dehydrogenase [Halalkalibacillus sediminis]|uniref:Alcohol dehydrogenase n=1 Tax=Halalkalibacillus sediminis TaxID=2018042 RepID=A0A2I0QU29_9BACI|nr:alcohol dehydrogenase [Halalkalibacillus sediminis]
MTSSLHFPNTIHSGAGSFDQLAEAATALGTTNIFMIVSSNALDANPQLERQIRALKRIYSITLFSEYHGEPNSDHLDSAAQKALMSRADTVVGIGGGSALDLAKAVAFQAKNTSIPIQEIPNLHTFNRLHLISVPTTAGTGSEVTKITVITDKDTKVKFNPAHPRLIPDVAILDPTLTTNLPAHVTAFTGMDALTHAIEAYLSTRATAMTDHFALQAIQLIGKYLPVAYQEPDNLCARENMLIGSSSAGIAFSNSSTNLAHAAARPLGARFNIPHGLSVAMVLPFVIEYGLPFAGDRYAQLANVLKVGDQPEDVLHFIEHLNETFGIYQHGKLYFQHNELEQQIPQMVQDALSGNGIETNRKVPEATDVEKIYRKLLEKLN